MFPCAKCVPEDVTMLNHMDVTAEFGSNLPTIRLQKSIPTISEARTSKEVKNFSS